MDDLISRKAFMRHVEEEYMQWGSDYDIGQVLGDLEDFPGIQAERKTGYWLVKQDHNGSTYGECSQCHSIQYAGHTPYCPYCGSKMEDKQ